MRKAKEPIINSVEYYYVGENKDFDLFLKSVIQKYLSEDVSGLDFIDNAEKETA